MKTRREFLQGCLYASLGGLASGALFSCAGCRRNQAQSDAATAAAEAPPKAHIRSDFEPAYLKLHRSGELRRRGEALHAIMKECRLCPRECGADRLGGQKGFCQADARLQISAFNPHFGEERGLVGRYGSGTIFLTNCSLRCVFCCNGEISQEGEGEHRTADEMAGMMLQLQRIGCHNINLVTPTHYSAHILLATEIAASKGLRLPLVYNTCGWERLDILKVLDGVVDIYLPDYKYADAKMAAKYSSGADGYPEGTGKAIVEMNRQVGVARPAPDGLIYRGTIVRHLVMPNGVSGTRRVLKWISENLPKDTYVNLMSQYKPYYKAKKHPEINRRITRDEYDDAVRAAREFGLINVDCQGYPG